MTSTPKVIFCPQYSYLHCYQSHDHHLSLASNYPLSLTSLLFHLFAFIPLCSSSHVTRRWILPQSVPISLLIDQRRAGSGNPQLFNKRFLTNSTNDGFTHTHSCTVITTLETRQQLEEGCRGTSPCGLDTKKKQRPSPVLKNLPWRCLLL